LQPWSLLRKALIRVAKTSYTTGTLDEIKPEINKNIKTPRIHAGRYIKNDSKHSGHIGKNNV